MLILLDPGHTGAVVLNLVGLATAALSGYLLSRVLGERRRNLARAELVEAKLCRLVDELDQDRPGRRPVLERRLGRELDLARPWLEFLIRAEAYDRARTLDAAIGVAASRTDTAKAFKL